MNAKLAGALTLVVLLGGLTGCSTNVKDSLDINSLFIFTVVLLLMLVVMIVLFMKNNKTRRLYKDQVALLSAIFESVPDSVYSKDINGVYTS